MARFNDLVRGCLEKGEEVSLRGAVGAEAISFPATDCFASLAMTCTVAFQTRTKLTGARRPTPSHVGMQHDDETRKDQQQSTHPSHDNAERSGLLKQDKERNQGDPHQTHHAADKQEAHQNPATA